MFLHILMVFVLILPIQVFGEKAEQLNMENAGLALYNLMLIGSQLNEHCAQLSFDDKKVFEKNLRGVEKNLASVMGVSEFESAKDEMMVTFAKGTLPPCDDEQTKKTINTTYKMSANWQKGSKHFDDASGKSKEKSKETILKVSPRGAFAAIDIESQNAAFDRVLRGDELAIESVTKKPENFNPAVLFAVSSKLFESTNKDDALFWFYLAQLRARSDANKALDVSARSAVSALTYRFGADINKYAMRDVEKLKVTVNTVIDYDKKNKRAYNPRWIAFHGLEALKTDGVLKFEPISRWEAINKNTREQYLDGFNKAISSFDENR